MKNINIIQEIVDKIQVNSKNTHDIEIHKANRWWKTKDSRIVLTTNNGNVEIEILNPIDEELSKNAILSGEFISGVADKLVSSMQNYIFEMDDAPLEEQLKYIDILKYNVINRSVFSGTKSYHNRITIDSPNIIEKEEYHYIWNCLNKLFFDGKADSQCKNPSRRTRVPNAWRTDANKEQTLIVNNNNILYCYNFFHKKYLEKKEQQHLYNIRQRYLSIIRKSKFLDFSVKNNSKVQYYLNTPFYKNSGNGNSNISLYTAICVCISANDYETLNLIIDKAKSEKWSNKEIFDKIKNAKKFCKKY